MSDLTPELCQQAHEVASSLLLKILMAVKILLGLIGCGCVFHLYRKVGLLYSNEIGSIIYECEYKKGKSLGLFLPASSECQSALPGPYLLCLPLQFLLPGPVCLPTCPVRSPRLSASNLHPQNLLGQR